MFKRLFIKWTNGIVHWFSLRIHSFVQFRSHGVEQGKKMWKKLAIHFLTFAYPLARFALGKRWGCWRSLICVTLQSTITIHKQCVQWKKRVTGITSATMTTMNHIELGHGHTEASALLLFPISHICNYFYKNSTHQIPSSIDCQNQFVCTDSHFHPARRRKSRRRIIARISMKKNIAFYAFLVITNVQWV